MEEATASSLRKEDEARASAWLSRGLEALVADHPDIDAGREKSLSDPGDSMSPGAAGKANAQPFHFDFVIVGSGYGGAVAASELTRFVGADGSRPSVCILERGSEYLSGMFPQRMADLAGHARFATPEAKTARGVLDGLFDVRVGPDVNAIVASGLGGGSLINAGVMEMPHRSVFQEARWPEAIRDDPYLYRLGAVMKRRLGAKPHGSATRKFTVLEQLAGTQTFRPTDITVAPTTGPNSANTLLDQCIGCGDCVTGCNYNAKDSLDLNLLRVAHAAGAKAYTGATVLRLEKSASGPGWVVVVNHADGHLRTRQRTPFRLRARRVILSAGTFGSTEILMRSQGLPCSPQLGKKFSCNGDMIATIHHAKTTINAIANERKRANQRKVGPTITAMIDLRTGDPQTDAVIQDLSIPGPLRRLFEETVTTADALNKLLEPDPLRHAPNRPFLDSAAVNSVATAKSLVVAMIGRDSADGMLERRNGSAGDAADGLLTIDWPALRHDPRLAFHHERLKKLMEASPLKDAANPARCRILANPTWRPLSDDLENVFGTERGPLLTVHPLGGCPMGDNVDSGVVDHCGRVFDASASDVGAVHDGLFVLDGSIVPTSLGINPSLTIAVLALRAMRELRSVALPERRNLCDLAPPRLRRPSFAVPHQLRAAPTMVEITEQLCGRVFLEGDAATHPGHGVEITLTYEPTALAELTARRGDGRIFRVNSGKGLLRVTSMKESLKQGEYRQDQTELEADLSGTLRVFHHGRTCPWLRRFRGMYVWWAHRGFRDVVQDRLEALRRWLRVRPQRETKPQGVWKYLRNIYKLSDHTGSVRLLEYELRIANAKPLNESGLLGKDFEGKTIKGFKRLTYELGSNPWAQLQELALHEFPRLERWWSIRAALSALRLGCSSLRQARDRYLRRAQLALNLDHLVSKGVPLLRIVAQQDRPSALGDLLSFGLYVARIVLQAHALTFRKPDLPTDRQPVRLPSEVERLPSPEIEWLIVERRKSDCRPIRIRLVRYRELSAVASNKMQGANPVLLIHGYSASGTTYAHSEVEGNLAETLCNAGRDVWIVDMRSSAGLASATEGWKFEDMALVDIPRAIQHILQVAPGSDGKIDVVAHCMGSAMFSMALLADTPDKSNHLSERIGRAVLSQVGPVLKLSTANVFRAYVMRWIRYSLSLDDYSFRPKGKPTLGGQMLDRILATTQYPRDEFRLENPLLPPGRATPWAAARHRMDAIYARTFKLANLSPGVLDHIDDFFGPLSLETVSQVIHFARFQTITNRFGFNEFVVPFRLRSRIVFPVLYLHGEDNGILDAATLDLMRDRFKNARITHLNPKGEHLRSADDAIKLIDRGRHSRLQKCNRGSLMTWCIAGHGHQDPLIGIHAGEVSKVIARFLAR